MLIHKILVGHSMSNDYLPNFKKSPTCSLVFTWQIFHNHRFNWYHLKLISFQAFMCESYFCTKHVIHRYFNLSLNPLNLHGSLILLFVSFQISAIYDKNRDAIKKDHKKTKQEDKNWALLVYSLFIFTFKTTRGEHTSTIHS